MLSSKMPWFCGEFLRTAWTNLRAVVVYFREFDLKFKPKKCALFQSLVEFLGRKANQSGAEMGDEHIEAMRK